MVLQLILVKLLGEQVCLEKQIAKPQERWGWNCGSVHPGAHADSDVHEVSSWFSTSPRFTNERSVTLVNLRLGV